MSIKIKNKLESDKLIKMLNLNQFPQINIRLLDEKSLLIINQFLSENKNCKFAIRDTMKANSKLFQNNLTASEVLENIKNQTNFCLTVSGLTYLSNKKLVGEIYISSAMDLTINASTNPCFTTRDASLRSEYTLNTNIFDKRIKDIPYINCIIDYIFTHGLFDMIVEFTVFDKPLGIKQENVIIWELRTEY